ncbi:neuronal acetylcholine receptor subunit alpha-5 [Gossypium australe]|uniref:Neuronal acetylcholine receptor subunit alpha-5 n=1 Tax=Gossypium australe TaxID=47621 RepID=A0A5B6UH43_9ROSI|nr:neuronal acetylcholine receptor subunit alpha-5 [Gossypium australe]
MGGGMEANKNRFIEDWSSARENLEHNFRWTRRNFALVGIFGIAIPVLVYKGIVREFDEDNGRPYRKFLLGFKLFLAQGTLDFVSSRFKIFEFG